ncbi:AMP-binding protein (plasmid) [Pseudoalteromonas espejiana]
MVGNAEQVSGCLDKVLNRGTEVVVTALPLYHIFALTANCLTFMKCNWLKCANYKSTARYASIFILKFQPTHKFTAITGVNTLFNGLLNTPGFADLNFSHLKMSLGGGMAVQRPVAEKWQKVTSSKLMEGYGLY